MEIKKISRVKLSFRSSSMPSTSSAMMLRLTTLAFILLLFFGAPANAQEKDAPYVPTPDNVVDKMLDMAHVGPEDYVIDLGCGDGRIIIAAARRGAIGLGVDLDEELIKEARENAREAGVSDKVMFLKQDLFKTDISGANVITLYLFPDLINKLRPEFTEKLEPGARIVSHDFDMDGWEPDQHAQVNSGNLFPDTLILPKLTESDTYSPLLKDVTQNQPLSLLSHEVYYWKVPAEAQGRWKWQTNGEAFTMTVDQNFQKIQAEIRTGNTALTIESKKLMGDRITIHAVNPETKTRYLLNGHIEKDTIKGKIQIRSDEDKRIENWTANQN
ncbi:MAG: SAM-dependent methyltransferase [Bacteroidales bacterium]